MSKLVISCDDDLMVEIDIELSKHPTFKKGFFMKRSPFCRYLLRLGLEQIKKEPEYKIAKNGVNGNGAHK